MTPLERLEGPRVELKLLRRPKCLLWRGVALPWRELGSFRRRILARSHLPQQETFSGVKNIVHAFFLSDAFLLPDIDFHEGCSGRFLEESGRKWFPASMASFCATCSPAAIQFL